MTDLENKLLRNIAENNFAPGNGAPPATYADTGAVWSNCLVFGPESIALPKLGGIVALLLRKGLITQQGQGGDAVVCLTLKGFDAYQAARN